MTGGARYRKLETIAAADFAATVAFCCDPWWWAIDDDDGPWDADPPFAFGCLCSSCQIHPGQGHLRAMCRRMRSDEDTVPLAGDGWRVVLQEPAVEMTVIDDDLLRAISNVFVTTDMKDDDSVRSFFNVLAAAHEEQERRKP